MSVTEDGLTLPTPPLSVCILVVGTHGDINPFLGLADRLLALGHRVRVATHALHRRLVLTRGHDFYPLAGDPRKLSKWMVKTGGTLLGEAKNLGAVPEKTQMTHDIIQSTWPAVTAPSPDDLDQRPFEADAIIANPPVFGHIHVAEALGIPLHVMFPQPWYYGTRDYPHPLIGMPYDKPADANFHTYAAFEGVAWSSMEGFMNSWRRKTLDIPVVYFGMGASTLIPDSGVSFSAMWSPSFVPKPEDWPKQCRVVGTFTDQKVVEASTKKVFDLSPFTDLIEWLEEGPDPIFVGFGSMVIADPSLLANMIMSAAEKAECRVVVQSSWSNLDVSASDRCHMVGPCPHDWLLPQTCAVVHHGGAGTTAAGLRWGLPTFICPFFGDQHMWGAMVARAGVGPTPCPVGDLTDDLLAEKFKELTSPEIKAKAEQMADNMSKEDGIQGGLDHFLDDLPRDNMLCDVSLLLGEAKVAKYDVWGWHKYRLLLTPENGIKISTEVRAVLESWGYGVEKDVPAMVYFKSWLSNTTQIGGLRFRRHGSTMYALGRVRDFKGGCLSSIYGCLRHVGLATIQIFYRPDSWARDYGLMGCLCGLVASPFYIIYEILRAFTVLLDRFFTGIANGCCHKNELKVIDNQREARVHETGNTIPPEVDGILANGIPIQRKKEIYRAGEIAIVCKDFFLRSSPYYPDDGHWHYRVVSADKLLATLKRDKAKLKLNRPEFDALSELLTERADGPISFSMFLLLVHHAIETRPSPRTIGTSTRDRLHLFNTDDGIRQWTQEMFGNPLNKMNLGSVAKFELGGIDEEGEDDEEDNVDEDK